MTAIPLPMPRSFPSIILLLIIVAILGLLMTAGVHGLMSHGVIAEKAYECFNKNGAFASFVEPMVSGDTIHHLCMMDDIIYDILCRIGATGKWEIFNGFIPKGGDLFSVTQWLSRKPGIYQTTVGYGGCR